MAQQPPQVPHGAATAGPGRAWRWAAFLFGLIGIAAAFAQASAPEAEVKAAYLLKFLSYAEWPGDVLPSPDQPIVLGVLGSNAVAASGARLAGSLDVNGHPVVVRPLAVADASALDGIHVLFVGAGVADGPALLRAAIQRSILTVTEAGPDRPADSMINLALVDNRIRFDVALAPVRSAGLRLSSRLLQVADRILGTP